MHLDPAGWRKGCGPWLGVLVKSWEAAAPPCALARSELSKVGGQAHTFLHLPLPSLSTFLLEVGLGIVHRDNRERQQREPDRPL